MYYPEPAALPSSGPVPVLFWVYGGGLTSGDRKLPPPNDLTYGNLGVFFAQRGYVLSFPPLPSSP